MMRMIQDVPVAARAGEQKPRNARRNVT